MSATVAPTLPPSSPLNHADPRSADRGGLLTAWARTLVREERDLHVVRIVVLLSMVSMIPAAVLFALPSPLWWLALLYPAMVLTQFTDRYTLMLHVVSHRALFKRRHRWMNHWMPAVLGLFFGQTPYTYYAHHIGMHHAEGNLRDDLSTTMHLHGDSLWHWCRYAGRFFVFGMWDLAQYFRRTRKPRLLRMILLGELGWLCGVVGLAMWKPVPTFFVFVLPVLILRLAMMQGNWAQHAFVDMDDPANPYKSSVDLINSRHNRRCFNDGYHIVHHCKPPLHWTEMPAEFEANRDEYARHDAMVFDGVANFIELWGLLMRKDYDTLAERFVDLRGGRSKDEIKALIRSRTRRPGLA
jgi:fatty acid desaturase